MRGVPEAGHEAPAVHREERAHDVLRLVGDQEGDCVRDILGIAYVAERELRALARAIVHTEPNGRSDHLLRGPCCRLPPVCSTCLGDGPGFRESRSQRVEFSCDDLSSPCYVVWIPRANSRIEDVEVALLPLLDDASVEAWTAPLDLPFFCEARKHVHVDEGPLDVVERRTREREHGLHHFYEAVDLPRQKVERVVVLKDSRSPGSHVRRTVLHGLAGGDPAEPRGPKLLTQTDLPAKVDKPAIEHLVAPRSDPTRVGRTRTSGCKPTRCSCLPSAWRTSLPEKRGAHLGPRCPRRRWRSIPMARAPGRWGSRGCAERGRRGPRATRCSRPPTQRGKDRQAGRLGVARAGSDDRDPDEALESREELDIPPGEHLRAPSQGAPPVPSRPYAPATPRAASPTTILRCAIPKGISSVSRDQRRNGTPHSCRRWSPSTTCFKRQRIRGSLEPPELDVLEALRAPRKERLPEASAVAGSPCNVQTIEPG